VKGYAISRWYAAGAFETSGGRVREEDTPTMVGVAESFLRCTDSLPIGRPDAESHRPNILLRKHYAALGAHARAPGAGRANAIETITVIPPGTSTD